MNQDNLKNAVQQESKQFQEAYTWLDAHMPLKFFKELDPEKITLVSHSLMSFHLQDHFSEIRLKTSAIALCLDGPDADLRVLKHYRFFGIRNYSVFVSDAPVPGTTSRLKIAVLSFTEAPLETPPVAKNVLPAEQENETFNQLRERNPDLTQEEFHKLLEEINPSFLRSLAKERLILGLDMYFRAKTRDPCQYEVRYNEDWQEKKDMPSMQIVMAWRNVPKHNFLFRLAKVIYRHGLQIVRLNASYVHTQGTSSVMLLSLGLHGVKGKATWEEVDIVDFLQELVTVKYFEGLETIESTFVDSNLVSGNMGNLLKTMVHFIHQVLVQADLNMYSFSRIEEGICRHPELTVQLCKAFALRFHPERHNQAEFEKVTAHFLKLIDQLDTGNELNDTRRKNILRQGLNFVRYTLKTNFYQDNKTAFSFRLDPKYLDDVPFERKDKFPELPFGIFFMKGMHFFSFHIRFKDLSRGGLRTVCPEHAELFFNERNNVFTECYGLAYTQQKKNKDIPEGGSKGVILLEPYDSMLHEAQIYQKELEITGIPKNKIESQVHSFNAEHKLEFLYQSQRAYIESLMTLINCNPDGTLKAKNIVDYYKHPEYLYLGPDENSHNVMLEWIAWYSKKCGYKPGSAFISSKPSAGINHKEYGVTSLGVNVYLEETLKYLGIDPQKQPFTLKMTGGPDGDVAGNEMLNLYKFYPKTAKLLAITDVSGTIYDPEGLDLALLADLFKRGVSINQYPPEKLHNEGFLLDVRNKREQTAYAQQSLCWRMKEGRLIEDWLNGNEMNHLWRHNVLKTKADVFIPAGGRPRTLNDTNWEDFLDETGIPSSRAIVEGANLFLTPLARRSLENLGVLIIKDSSANKGGVICSSFEVLSGLVMSEEEFLRDKHLLVEEILQVIKERARSEALLLLRTYKETGKFLTELSDLTSERINSYTYEILDHLQTIALSSQIEDPLIQCLLHYCPPLLRRNYSKRILTDLPDIHKKAIIACYIAQKLVYQRGLAWLPSVVDILPLIIQDKHLIDN
ncbi:MAG: NAD-glutamate dehydrogenase [Simkania sp.]|nr:NAD-glutamate dehydrogenase [Simkania sp.]